MFGRCNTRTEQVTRSAVTPSLKYIWVNQLLVPNLTNNSKCVTSIMSHSSFKWDKIDEILTSVNVIFNVPRAIVQIAYHLRQKSPLHFATSHNTLQQSQLHTWQSQLHILCRKTHNFRPWTFPNSNWTTASGTLYRGHRPRLCIALRSKKRLDESFRTDREWHCH